ncbi:MAG TPA: carboxymuconolactone decarboxylase family protein, partial [Anaeromyxobacteraceae bacterium]|nr:carboxymuconolactone decarboxylase family protein [Anaeromyxobacteraceae bacterium]
SRGPDNPSGPDGAARERPRGSRFLGRCAMEGILADRGWLSIMAIGTLNRADYEWAQHEKEFLAAGGTQEQLTALRDVPAVMEDAKRFDEAERATLALTVEMTRNVKVSDATMKRIRALLPDQQVVELVGTIAGYNMVSRFLVATGIELE